MDFDFSPEQHAFRGQVRAWLAEQPQSKSRRTIAKFALENAVKNDASLRQLFE